MKNRKLILITGVLSLQIVASITLAGSLTYAWDYAKVPQGFQVWGKDLSGLSLEEGYKQLEKEIPYRVTYKDSVYSVVITQSKKNLAEWLNQKLKPESNLWWDNAYIYLKKMGAKQLSPDRLDKKEIIPQLESLAKQINQNGQAASISLQNGQFTVHSGSPSVTMDVSKSWERLNQSEGSKIVPLVVNVQDLAPNEAELSKIKDKLADYTTYFNQNQQERTNNVRLAAKALNGQIIAPNGEFSFNEVVGKRAKETGYLPAYTFVDQKVVLDDGGGICQDSSTLYHAALQSHLQILERSTHSLPVNYVPKGQDATVAYGLLDFRFKNTSQNYIYLDVRTGPNWLRIRIYGLADKEHPVLLEPEGYPISPMDDGLK